MPYKNDDLERLFRKAAKNYPLNTDNSDWDDLASKLNSSVKDSIETRKKKLRYGALFVMCAIGSIMLYKLQFSSNNIEKQASIQHGTSKQNPNKHKPAILPRPGEHSTVTIKESDFNLKDLVLAKTNTVSIKANGQSISNNIQMNNDILNVMPLAPVNLGNVIINEVKPMVDDAKGRQGKEKLLNDDAAKKLVENSNNEDEVSNIKEVQLKPTYRIYGTFYGGPQFSIVKFQHVSNPGYRLGVSLGYRVNRRFSLELKLQREHINFYSNGTYIDTTLLSIRPNTSIEKANASSKITSVPIAVRYNFSSKGSGHFFVTAGVNAVIITHNEQYNYEVSKNGVEGNFSRKYNSLKSPKYFQGVNASAGFETKLINWCNLKVEPYYQAPVNNFGVGKLPVSNFGVEIGIVKNLK
jgi:hypothetical protein